MEITESALTAQYQRVSSAWPFIHQTELARGLPRMLLFAVGSREPTSPTRSVTSGTDMASGCSMTGHTRRRAGSRGSA